MQCIGRLTDKPVLGSTTSFQLFTYHVPVQPLCLVTCSWRLSDGFLPSPGQELAHCLCLAAINVGFGVSTFSMICLRRCNSAQNDLLRSHTQDQFTAVLVKFELLRFIS